MRTLHANASRYNKEVYFEKRTKATDYVDRTKQTILPPSCFERDTKTDVSCVYEVNIAKSF